mgnify:CR=1 FL=1
MRMRDRLFVFSTVQLLLFGALFPVQTSARNGLSLGGGICVAAGGTAALVGTVIWFLARKQSSDAKAKAAANKVSLLPTGLGFHF